MSKGAEGEKGALLRGTLELLVLRILAGGSKHGYAISTRLSELSKQWLQVDEGSLYPCLYRMEERGWIRSAVAPTENKRQARYYTLTQLGHQELVERSNHWRQFTGVVAAVLKRG